MPPFAYQLAAEIPKESGYAGPDQPTQPPSSHTATRVHSTRSSSVTVSQLGEAAGEGGNGGDATLVVDDGELAVVVVVLGGDATERGHDVGHSPRWRYWPESPVVDGTRGAAVALRADVIEERAVLATGLVDEEPMDVAASAALV